MDALLIADPFPIASGGGQRSYQVLLQCHRVGITPHVIFPPFAMGHTIGLGKRNPEMDRDLLKSFSILEGAGIHFLTRDFFTDQYMMPGNELRISALIGKYLYYTFSLVTYPRSVQRYIDRYCKNLPDVDLVYSHHENLDCVLLAYFLAHSLKKPFIIYLQGVPYVSLKDDLFSRDFSRLRSLVNIPQIIGMNLAARMIYSKTVKSPHFRGFLANSTVPLTRFRLESTPHAILRPPVAIDPVLTRYRCKKADYAVCVSRISIEKGVLDLPAIWSNVVKINPDARLFVFGNPSKLSKTILDMAEKQGISRNLLLMGYQPPHELFTAVSRARVMVFPSQKMKDAYPIALIESLALGTPVVTYDIEPYVSMFSGIDAVRNVAFRDFEAMGKEICKWMDAGEDEYQQVFQSHRLNEFLALHSSWERVAVSERENLAFLMDQNKGSSQ